MLKLTASFCLFLITITCSYINVSANSKEEIHRLPISLVGYAENVQDNKISEENVVITVPSYIRKPTSHDVALPDRKITISDNIRKRRSIEKQISQEEKVKSMEIIASQEKLYRRRRSEEDASKEIVYRNARSVESYISQEIAPQISFSAEEQSRK